MNFQKNYGEEESISFDENKTLTLITNEEIGNVVIEILASKENFDKNEEEIEHIVESIQIKEWYKKKIEKASFSNSETSFISYVSKNVKNFSKKLLTMIII